MLFYAIVGTKNLIGVKQAVIIESDSYDTALAAVMDSGKILRDTVLVHCSSKEEIIRRLTGLNIHIEDASVISDKTYKTAPVPSSYVKSKKKSVEEIDTKEVSLITATEGTSNE